MLHLLSGIAYQHSEYTAFDRVILKIASSLMFPLLRTFLRIHKLHPAAASDEERFKLVSQNGELVMNAHGHNMEHFSHCYERSVPKINLIHLCEGGLDWYLGRMQKIVRDRGGGGTMS